MESQPSAPVTAPGKEPGSLASLTSKKSLKSFGKHFLAGFMGHDVMTLSAALAFYTALSLAPLLIIVLAVMGALSDVSQAQFVGQIKGLIGEQAGQAVNSIIQSAQSKPNTGTIAGIIGLITLIFSASGVFAQLQSSLNKIWNVQGKASAGAWSWIRKRLLSMGMVITLGFLAVVSLGASTALAALFGKEEIIWQAVNWFASLAVFTLMFALILKFLPDTKLSWRNSLSGGLVTAVLFMIGKALIGLYLGRSAVGSSYGAAGSLIVLLLWVYYSSIIVFSGAEVTRLLAAQEGFEESKQAQPSLQKTLPKSLKPQPT